MNEKIVVLSHGMEISRQLKENIFPLAALS
jgi:hypothetical protein